MSARPVPERAVRVPYDALFAFTAELFAGRGVPAQRARVAAEALCHGDLHGVASHGLVNLTRLYLPLFDSGQVDPVAAPRILVDLGASVTVDAGGALGLWFAAEAMDLATTRAGEYGVGLVAARGATHFGCAGYHTRRAADRGMLGVITSNCGRQRIARPPHGRPALLGTNPLSVAAPATDGHPFVLDMSTTTVPTGRVRAAARRGAAVPEGWLEDAAGAPVTDPAAFDRGEAFLTWLGGTPETGAYKGFGLGLVVEVLSALLPGAATGPAPEALDGDGTPQGRDDDIGFFVLAVAPELLTPDRSFPARADALFTTLLRCPPRDGARAAPSYPGWDEAELARDRRRDGVPLDRALYEDLVGLGFAAGGPG